MRCRSRKLERLHLCPEKCAFCDFLCLRLCGVDKDIVRRTGERDEFVTEGTGFIGNGRSEGVTIGAIACVHAGVASG